MIKAKKYDFLLLILIAFALTIRVLLLKHVSQDYILFLSGWVDYFRNGGGLKALAGSVGNYNIPYLTFLALISYLKIDSLLLIKLFSILFDFLLAWAAKCIVVKLTRDFRKGVIAFGITILLPTVIINSSFWGQCDSIYVSLALMGLYYGLDDRPWLSVVLIATSFAFKLQAIFIMPIYAVLWMRRKLNWYHFLAFPLVYAIMMLPAVIAGKPFLDTMILYSTQTESIGTGYSYNAPSLLSIIDAGRTVFAGLNTGSAIPIVSKAFIIIAFVVTISILVVCLTRRKDLNDYNTVLIAALFAVLIPYLLPHMHDRYFYGADILLLILAITCLRNLPAFLLVSGASLWSYICYYRYVQTETLLPVYIGAASIGIAILFILRSLAKEGS